MNEDAMLKWLDSEARRLEKRARFYTVVSRISIACAIITILMLILR